MTTFQDKFANKEETIAYLSTLKPGGIRVWMTPDYKWLNTCILYELVDEGFLDIYHHPDGLWVGDQFIVKG